MIANRSSAGSPRRSLAGALLVVLTLAACGAAATPSPTPPPAGGAESPGPTPTAVPGASGGTGAVDPGNGAGSGGDPGGGTDPGTGNGGGIIDPGILFPPGAPDDPMLGEAKYVKAADGLIDQRKVNVQLVRAAIEDGKAIADLRWWSGVEACNQLDEVQIERDDTAKTIRLVVIEGSVQGDMMCIEIAELHATAVDLGELASGTWTISAEGDAPAIKLDVP
jgi:hypothetical protein